MDMDMELELNNFLEADSDFVDSLCQQLEDVGIHLNNEMLSRILLSYEEQKTQIVTGFLESILGGEDLPFPTDGSSIIHMVVGNKSQPRDFSDDNLEILDSDYIV
ncbi:MAG: hypothetical protein FWF59_04625 [Turicibacter sp.]|nr:hypothetical protein [Turicibacter sp.]